MDQNLLIDCATCVVRDTEACTDCVVTFLCDRQPGDAVIIDVEDLRALRMLRDAGLAPELRHRRGTIGA
jgi:hypothetical protein